MTIDPVAQAADYQQMLLALLGKDDPAEVQRATPALWRALVNEAGAYLRAKPAPNEWSVLELLGHAADAEIVVAGRLRWILSQDRPPIVPYDQDLWVDALHAEADPEALLADLETLKRSNASLWERTTPAQRARVGVHEERGPESFELTYRMLAGHDRFHLDQARRTLEQVRASAS